MIRAVVFDLDDTLFSETDYVLSGFKAVSEWIEKRSSVKGFFEAAEDFFQKGSRGNIFDLTLKQLGIEYSNDLISEMVRFYRGHRPNIALLDDARWALDFFIKSKKLGIITDGYLLAQKNKVSALGIENLFDIIVYTDELGRDKWKPSEIPYRRVMEALSCEGSECVYIADNPVKDFVAAKALGWLTVHIKRPSGQYSGYAAEKGYAADIEIVSLYELKEIIS